ncbi:MAG TPA: monofunctional biosynthetic peptidoglycan transglycosylase [Smithellaceae bacterium]|nr:monofunctional biosynthetic peptidoglycan transglycosylase [Syntrophaceae bacterium]HPV48563.1 monofunctional biosynthetic peptidoglycan transglycosylase [Smithellaceae bacterium]
MKRLFKTTILCLLIALPVFLLVDIGRYFFYPDVSLLKNNRPGKTAFMEHREKVWRSKNIKKKIRVSWVPLSQISPYVMKAVIIAEDDKFWSHEGFDFEAMQKALEKNLDQKKFKMGGSTISQQLAKNLYLSPTKSPVRKVKEAILTWRIERHLSKRRIMELYLNVAEWGDGLFGIRAAARRYYGKSPAALNAREAAALAASLPSPQRFHPASGSRYAARRAARIYQIMERRGIVIREYDEVVQETKEKEAAKEETAKEEKTSTEDTGLFQLPEDFKIP